MSEQPDPKKLEELRETLEQARAVEADLEDDLKSERAKRVPSIGVCDVEGCDREACAAFFSIAAESEHPDRMCTEHLLESYMAAREKIETLLCERPRRETVELVRQLTAECQKLNARPNRDESDCAALLCALAGDVVQPDLGWFGRITDELAACRTRGSR